ncbi:MAG TPA: PHP domain-containing protein [Smithellaceae bacterium]|nr:PHP domain-containing protein [Smithellaceae bacterium]
MIFDLHVHTTHSPCSKLRLDEIISLARTRGLDGVAITDHNSMECCREVIEGIQDNGICLLVGMEYDTPEGDFLLFGSFEDLKTGLSASDLLSIVADRQGVAISAHPCREGRSLKPMILSLGVCRIIEGLNGRNSDEENRNVEQLRRQYPLFQCGGSDAHSLEELGRTATCFEEKITSREELIAALKKGQYRPVRGKIGSQL